MLASKNGHTKVAKLLIDHHAQVDLQNSEGLFALVLALKNGHTKLAKLLLDHHAHKGWSALMHVFQSEDSTVQYSTSLSRSRTELATLLVESGAEVNLLNDEGKSALRISLLERQADIVLYTY